MELSINKPHNALKTLTFCLCAMTIKLQILSKNLPPSKLLKQPKIVCLTFIIQMSRLEKLLSNGSLKLLKKYQNIASAASKAAYLL
ncbi:hypothetical protein [Phaeodactylibacter xiamenensis]|jgi:hypothetical protein|uniref:hypothetical protein n=1 Tax=Phaeodactylibacter xiamenensis TaxID=1524460 RepID=UPI003D0BB76B